MTTMADLTRRECACGNVWYAEMTEHPCDECRECFLKRVGRTKIMTTMQVRDDHDQTPPEEAAPEAVNGHADAERPKRQRKARAAAVGAPHITTGVVGTPNQLEPTDDIVTRLEATVREINAEEARLEGQLERIRKARQALVGTGFGEVIIGTRPNVPDYVSSHGAQRGGKVMIHRVSSAKSSTRHRRTEAEIHAGVTLVVNLVKRHKEGLGAQKIREALGLDKKEMPKLLKTALESKALKSKGQKRATLYFAKS
jgi:hypothetical protein